MFSKFPVVIKENTKKNCRSSIVSLSRLHLIKFSLNFFLFVSIFFLFCYFVLPPSKTFVVFLFHFLLVFMMRELENFWKSFDQNWNELKTEENLTFWNDSKIPTTFYKNCQKIFAVEKQENVGRHFSFLNESFFFLQFCQFQFFTNRFIFFFQIKSFSSFPCPIFIQNPLFPPPYTICSCLTVDVKKKQKQKYTLFWCEKLCRRHFLLIWFIITHTATLCMRHPFH